MPNWVLIVSTVFSGFLIAGGAFLFPYASSFFGVTDYKNARGKGKLIVNLIKLFPVTSVLALYLAWTSLSYLAIIPFLHFLLVYTIRENKNLANGPKRQFGSEAENFESLMTIMDVSWQSWLGSKVDKNLLLSTFFAEDEHSKSTLMHELESSGLELMASESSSSFKNGSVLLDVEVAINSFEREKIESLIKQLSRIAWKSECELRHVDVFASEQ
ncbi:MAG: hypothetical protein OQJ89_01780 [Kangiellaceae bacterium]|nr:hypothetical protein [Kangiellaceae bacterium]MCW9000456.1 hypothetical protein [Kangiellaceae bacterium]MCW9015673.1 hypothetical protein [Kangiellaceae bacterium]